MGPLNGGTDFGAGKTSAPDGRQLAASLQNTRAGGKMFKRKWKELHITDSMSFQQRLAGQLTENHLEYKLRTVNRNTGTFFPDRTQFLGSLGQNPDVLQEYRFYVNPEDYDHALHILRKCYKE